MPDLRPHQRAFALEIVEKLRAAGFESLWAGGCVRDQLLGLTPEGLRRRHQRHARPRSATCSATAARWRSAPRSAWSRCSARARRADRSRHLPHRRRLQRRPPSRQRQFTTAEHDAQRRDFTINGLFYDPLAEPKSSTTSAARKTSNAKLDPRHRRPPLATSRKTSCACSAPSASPPRSISRSNPPRSPRSNRWPPTSTRSAPNASAPNSAACSWTPTARAASTCCAKPICCRTSCPKSPRLESVDFDDTRRVLAGTRRADAAAGARRACSTARRAAVCRAVGRRLALYESKKSTAPAWLLATCRTIRDAPATRLAPSAARARARRRAPN